MEDIAITEKRHADLLAQDYSDKGYRVSREVFLDFFPKLRVDILAEKEDEKKVVEVKSRTSLARTPAIRELARILKSKAGWTFELSLVGEREKLDAPENARQFEDVDIVGLTETVKRLLDLGYFEAALMCAWSAFEATLRVLIEENGISIERVTTSAYILELAVSEGVISSEDYDSLVHMMRHRNAVAHGFKTTDLDSELITGLIETTQRISAQ